MSKHHATPIEQFCPLGCEIKTADTDSETWIVFDECLRKTLQHPSGLYRLFPAHEVQNMELKDRDATLISERLFYQLVLASPTPRAMEFRDWVADKLLYHWFELTGDLQDIYEAERLRSAPRSVLGASEAAVSEYLPTSREF